MARVRCSNGHYYDSSKSATCPFCSGFSFSNFTGVANYVDDNDQKTVSYAEAKDEQATVGFVAEYQKQREENVPDLRERNGNVAEPSVEEPDAQVFSPVVGWLVCLSGPEKGRDYRIHAGNNFIGRDISMDICIREDTAISRIRHASVVYDPRSGRYVFIPGVSSLSRVNDENILRPTDLKNDDTIEMGKSTFCFVAFCREGRTWNV